MTVILDTIYYEWPSYVHVNKEITETEHIANFNEALNAVKEAGQLDLDLLTRPGLMDLFRPFVTLFMTGLQLVEGKYWDQSKLNEIPGLIKASVDDMKTAYGNEAVKKVLSGMFQLFKNACSKGAIPITDFEKEFDKSLVLMSDAFNMWHQEILFPGEKVIDPATFQVTTDSEGKLETRIYEQCLIKNGQLDSSQNIRIEIGKGDTIVKVPPAFDFETHLKNELAFIKTYPEDKKGPLNFYLLQEYFRQLAFLIYAHYDKDSDNWDEIKENFTDSFVAWSYLILEIIFHDIFYLIENKNNSIDDFEMIYKRIEQMLFVVHFGLYFSLTYDLYEHEICIIRMSYMKDEMVYRFDFKLDQFAMLTEFKNRVPILGSMLGDLKTIDRVNFNSTLFFTIIMEQMKYGISFNTFENLIATYNAFVIYQASNTEDSQKIIEYYAEQLERLKNYWCSIFTGCDLPGDYAKFLNLMKLAVLKYATSGWTTLFKKTYIFLSKDHRTCKEYLNDTGLNISLQMDSHGHVLGALSNDQNQFCISWTREKLIIEKLSKDKLFELLNENLTFTELMRILLVCRALGVNRFNELEKKLKEISSKLPHPFEAFHSMAKEILNPSSEDVNDVLLRCKAMKFIAYFNLDTVYSAAVTSDPNPDVIKMKEVQLVMPNFELPPPNAENKLSTQQPKPFQNLVSVSLEQMKFSAETLECLRYKFIFENNQTQSIQVKSTSDNNGWLIIDAKDLTHFSHPVIEKYLVKLVSFIETKYSDLKDKEVFDSLILYISLIYCSKKSSFQNEKILSQLPKAVQSKHPKIYEKLVNMKFSSKIVDIFHGLMMTRVAAFEQDLDFGVLSVKITNEDTVMYFDFQACFMFLSIYIVNKTRVEMNDYLSKVKDAMAGVSRFFTTSAITKPYSERVEKVCCAFKLLYMGLLSVRQLLDKNAENHIVLLFVNLLINVLGYSELEAKDIADYCTYRRWDIDVQPLRASAEERFKKALHQRKRTIPLSQVDIYCLSIIEPDLKSLELYSDENCNDRLNDISLLINSELAGFSGATDSKSRFINLTWLIYLHILQLQENQRKDFQVELKEIISKFKTDNPDLKYVCEALDKRSETLFLSANIEDGFESLGDSFEEASKTEFEKYKNIPKNPSIKAELGQVEQVILDYEGVYLFFAISTSKGLVLLNQNMSEQNDDLNYVNQTTLNFHKNRYIHNLKQAESLHLRSRLGECIVLCSRAAINVTSISWDEAFNALWAEIQEACGNRLDQLKTELKQLFKSDYGELKNNLEKLRRARENIEWQARKDEENRLKREKLVIEEKQKKSSMNAFLMRRNLPTRDTLLGGTEFTVKRALSCFQTVDLTAAFGYVVKDGVKVPTVLRRVWSRTEKQTSEQVMAMFWELCDLMQVNQLNETKDDNTFELCLYFCAMLTLMTDNDQQLVFYQHQVTAKLSILIGAKSKLGQAYKTRFEYLQCMCEYIFEEKDKITLDTYQGVIANIMKHPLV
ncbi:hypothetical protein Ciccas_009153 [Cichlidogyrus casuarinus]|uniref:Uncharacterized protein n=1 Tax=Cichlidogyrus casuarinus TaxID=1844966 RepID=A0ABD2PXW7_9PLAT